MSADLAGLALGASIAWIAYAYVGYPLFLSLIGLQRPLQRRHTVPHEWPPITVVIPVFNGASLIRAALDAILALDYPRDRRQILVVSDASTDGTDALVRTYAPQDVELVRLDQRAGKTAAENAALGHARGEIVVRTDAAIRLDPRAVSRLVTAFTDPRVGVASGRDVSMGTSAARATEGESGYVGYEMRVRDLETRVTGIVGASGSLYAIRRGLEVTLPAGVARDFAAVLVAREQGYRAVSVPDAICFVPRGHTLREEYRRKVRTITRGLHTLWYKRCLLDPGRFGHFAWALFSHKLCRWIVPLAGLVGLGALVLLARTEEWAAWLLTVGGIGLVLAAAGWLWPARSVPRVLALPAYLVLSNVAVLHAWWNVARGAPALLWEPTRRSAGP